MEYTRKEMAEIALKLRAGETVEIDGVRIKAHKINSRNMLACAHCNVECQFCENLATICALTDKYEQEPFSGKASEYHYLEYADTK